jgi:hypothetical protein
VVGSSSSPAVYCEFVRYLLHFLTTKHDILPDSCPIWTVSMPQSCLLLISEIGNARGGWWGHLRRRTGVRQHRRWRRRFFVVVDVGGCRGCHSGWIHLFLVEIVFLGGLATKSF